MTCKLCLENLPLRNSHVVPEFFYKACYDEKHRIFPRSGGRVLHPPVQKGLCERLLCGTCETHLSGFEKYGREVLYGGVEIAAKKTPDGIELQDLDFTKIRVFLLSILWRMSVASAPMWSAVSLGPHDEPIRKMVLDGDPGSEMDYPVLCVVPLFEGEFLHDFILQPDFVRAHRGRFYRAILGGFLFMFYVSAVGLPEPGVVEPPKEDGSWFIPVQNALDIDFLVGDARRILGK